MSTLPQNYHLIEASWEVCNKVGGIHTVLTTKLAYAQAEFAGRYVTVGPKLASNPTFYEEEVPELWGKIKTDLANLGIGLFYGHWITEGHPPCILLDWSGLVSKSGEYKARFWEEHQLDTLNTDFYDVDTPLLWSIAVGHLVEAYAKHVEAPVLFHGHEWLAAGAFLVLAKNPAIKTVFTTHATVLGRALSSGGEDIYTKLAAIEPESTARAHNVTAKHQLERLSANLATVFTTVSSLTGREAEAFLKRKPTIITENGVDSALFPAFDELCIQHNDAREILHDFISSYFFPSYRFDLRNVNYQFTMGRYEAHNKGYDLYLQSLGELNRKLKTENSDKTVIALFFVPGDSIAPRREVGFQMAAQTHIKELLTKYSQIQQRELYHSLWREGEHLANIELIPPTVIEHIKQLISRLPVYENPPISPFDLRHPEQDAILQAANKADLTNGADDRVKVLFFPAYFDGFDGLFNRVLYELIAGCDLGVFPSLYEPWGYTPMESLAMGVPAITTDLAGFGLAADERAHDDLGTEIINREGRADADVATELTEKLYNYTKLPVRDQLMHRIGAYQTIQLFDWSKLYDRYLETYQIAIK